MGFTDTLEALTICKHFELMNLKGRKAKYLNLRNYNGQNEQTLGCRQLLGENHVLLCYV